MISFSKMYSQMKVQGKVIVNENLFDGNYTEMKNEQNDHKNPPLPLSHWQHVMY